MNNIMTHPTRTAAHGICPEWCNNHLTTDEGQEVCAWTRTGDVDGGTWYVQASEELDGSTGIDVWVHRPTLLSQSLTPTEARAVAAALLEVADVVKGSASTL